jgi:perosamine synthetase
MPYLLAIHLMSFYRDRFGCSHGQLPVAEQTAAASIALPFLPEMSEGQVARVAESLCQSVSLTFGSPVNKQFFTTLQHLN